MLDPDRYIGMDRAYLKIRFIEVVTSLAELRFQLHTAMVELTKSIHQSYNENYEQSEAAKKRIAEQSTYFLKETVDDLNTQILVYEDERDMLVCLMEMNSA